MDTLRGFGGTVDGLNLAPREAAQSLHSVASSMRDTLRELLHDACVCRSEEIDGSVLAEALSARCRTVCVARCRLRAQAVGGHRQLLRNNTQPRCFFCLPGPWSSSLALTRRSLASVMSGVRCSAVPWAGLSPPPSFPPLFQS